MMNPSWGIEADASGDEKQVRNIKLPISQNFLKNFFVNFGYSKESHYDWVGVGITSYILVEYHAKISLYNFPGIYLC